MKLALHSSSRTKDSVDCLPGDVYNVPLRCITAILGSHVLRNAAARFNIVHLSARVLLKQRIILWKGCIGCLHRCQVLYIWNRILFKGNHNLHCATHCMHPHLAAGLTAIVFTCSHAMISLCKHFLCFKFHCTQQESCSSLWFLCCSLNRTKFCFQFVTRVCNDRCVWCVD